MEKKCFLTLVAHSWMEEVHVRGGQADAVDGVGVAGLGHVRG